MIETERLLLREYTIDDFDALYEIMSDAETMQHYPAPFDETRTRRWIEWNLENYAQYGFGLWAVVLKETGEFIIIMGERILFRGIEGHFSIVDLLASLNIKHTLEQVDELPNKSDEILDKIIVE